MTIHGLNIPTAPHAWPTVPTHARLWDCGITWRNVNPAPEVWNWQRFDEIVDGARANGITNLSYVMAGTPQWAARNPSAPGAPWIGPGSSSAPWNMDLWCAYVSAVMHRYRGRIGSYQIWNEPQLKEFWGETSYEPLAEMTRLAYQIIKQIDPSVKVIAAPVLPRPSSGGMRRGKRYLRALKAKGWPCDIYAAHLYPEIGFTPGRWREFAMEWNSTLHAIGAPKKPRWVTETNFNIFGGRLNDNTVVDYMKRVDRIADELHIHKVYWYSWKHSDVDLFGVRFDEASAGTRMLGKLVKGA